MKKPKVVLIGGGTGTYTALIGLKKFNLDLSVIVSMMDSGGSNRVLRDEFGLLPTSDIRQCIVALASENSSKQLRDLFVYRYENGTGIAGMTFGNLFMAALTDIYGSQKKAIEQTCKMLGVTGNILPVTFSNSHLLARYSNGVQVLGEHFIDESDHLLEKHSIIELETIPPAKANRAAVDALLNADLIVLGPGDLYTSIICNLVVEGIAKAINKSKAKLVYILNLMTRNGQTNGMTATGHTAEITKYLNGKRPDFVLVHKGKKIPDTVLQRYRKEKAHPVVDDLKDEFTVIHKSLISTKVYSKAKSDKLTRSLIRHDSVKLAKAIVGLL